MKIIIDTNTDSVEDIIKAIAFLDSFIKSPSLNADNFEITKKRLEDDNKDIESLKHDKLKSVDSLKNDDLKKSNSEIELAVY